MNSEQEPSFVIVGTYNITDSQRITSILEANNIDFEYEMDDTAIKNLKPWQAEMGGTFGTGVNIHFYVHPENFEKTQHLLSEIYKNTEIEPAG